MFVSKFYAVFLTLEKQMFVSQINAVFHEFIKKTFSISQFYAVINELNIDNNFRYYAVINEIKINNNSGILQ